MRCAAVPSGREAAPGDTGGQAPCVQDQGHPVEEGSATQGTPKTRQRTSNSTCLDNLVDAMYGMHAEHAQPLPSGSKGSYGSVSWSPAQSLSICTDSGISADFSRTPCSHGKRVQGSHRHGVTDGYRQVCAADDCIASRLQPAAPGSVSWQPLSASLAPSRCVPPADSSWMLSPLGVCGLQTGCVPDRQPHKVCRPVSQTCSQMPALMGAMCWRVALWICTQLETVGLRVYRI